MMSGVPLETYWAFKKLWNNKFYYKAASCWYFYWVYCMYSQVSDTCTFILTVPPIVSIWDPRMHYKYWYIGSVLQKAWWWLNTVQTCCINCNCIIKLWCLTGICILYENKHFISNYREHKYTLICNTRDTLVIILVYYTSHFSFNP
jgi:hypothetical protein